jgi:serine-type D-Ala-D-Ala carboxypeptidase (penicillin-binding protein 5/6)
MMFLLRNLNTFLFATFLTLSTVASASANPQQPSSAAAQPPQPIASQQPVATTALAMPVPNAALPATATARPQVTPAAPTLNVKGYVLIDAGSGNLLASSNPDQRMPPASLTKMMTSYVISQALKEGRIKLDDQVRISEKAWRTGGSKMFVKIGDTIPLQDLIQGIIVHSGNDACVAMAEHIAGTEEAFAGLMNQQAAALGMTNTHFVDGTGLPNPQQYTSPRDMAILARALIHNFPEDYKWYAQKWFAFGGIKQPNRNRLLWRDPTVDGIKTGHTDEAGYCLAASALRNGTRLISVVMGAPSDNVRAEDTQRLLNYGFRFFETRKLYAGGTELTKARAWFGERPELPIGITYDFYVTFSPGQASQIKPTIVLDSPIKAPITKGQVVGLLTIELDGKKIGSAPLIALQDIPKAGLWTRLSDATKLKIRRLMGKEI